MKPPLRFIRFFIGMSIVISAGLATANSSDNLIDSVRDRQLTLITSQTAKNIASAAESAALKKGYSIVVSIVDNHGNLKYFNRMDNTSVGSIDVSQLKASTSAKFPMSTEELSKRSEQQRGNPYASIPGMLLLGGGLPIFNKAGKHIGSIGISGATPELDAEFARAGVDQYQ